MLLLRNRDVVGNGELATVCQSIQFVFKEIICIGITSITVFILDVDNSKAQIEKNPQYCSKTEKKCHQNGVSAKQGLVLDLCCESSQRPGCCCRKDAFFNFLPEFSANSGLFMLLENPSSEYRHPP